MPKRVSLTEYSMWIATRFWSETATLMVQFSANALIDAKVGAHLPKQLSLIE
jgi:hypothetical protein